MIWPLLRTRRWLAFSAVVVIAIVGFGLLSRWQWSRAEEHRLDRLALAASVSSAPVDVAVALRSPLPGDGFRAVTASGTYVAGDGVLVRRRPLDARNGFWAMTPLRLSDGRTVWVARGWLPAGKDALTTPPTPSPPTGTVAITGYLRPLDDAGPNPNEGLPEGQIAAVADAALPPLPSSVDAYIQLASSDPEQANLVTLPLPTIDESRNISYAVQWLLFAAVAMGGWYYFLRREAREDHARATAPTSPVLDERG